MFPVRQDVVQLVHHTAREAISALLPVGGYIRYTDFPIARGI